MKNSSKIKIAVVTTALGLLATGCNGPCGPWPEGTDLDGDGYACEVDCQDLSADIYPGAPELCDGWDNNCDGALPWMEIDHDGDGYISCDPTIGVLDCAPTHPEVHPGAPELCDGMDNDCDPSTPVWPGDDIDLDGDGAMACADCDDSDPDVYPGKLEDCDGLDSDCDGIGDAWVFKRELNVASDGEEESAVGFAANLYSIDESVALEGFAQRVSGFTTTFGVSSPRLLVYRWVGDEWTLLNATTLRAPTSGDWWRVQGDLGIPLEAGGQYLIGAAGFTGTTLAKLSLGTQPEALPMGEALAGYAGPSNMPLTFDEGAAIELPGRFAQSLVWREPSEIDQDGDGILLCLDCNDAGAEICDGFDGDCDGSPDPSEVDSDNDGFVECAGDCDPADGDVAPHREELCDGFDSNCMPEGVSGGEFDQDGDGFAPCEGDCDDNDPNAYPGAPELCDDIDQNCDGDTNDWRNDNDGDGVWDCFDCMPNYAGAAPGLEDTCTSMYDLNCDGIVGPGSDLDGDGVTDCEGDCDDNNPLVHPGMTEIDGDGVDNNCDGEVDGNAPAIRVSFDDLEIETMESFWAPADIRRPRTRGDYAVFTRAADGTIVDFEALEYDPLLHGMEVHPAQTWLATTGEYQLSGTVWLDATDAVQVVVATLDPYEEIDVRLAPAVAPSPPASGLGFGPSVADCWGLSGTPEEMLATLGSPGYFPWIQFNHPTAYLHLEGLSTSAPNTFDCTDSLPENPTEADVLAYGCLDTPTEQEIIGTCHALTLSSDSVMASVFRVSWETNAGAKGIVGGDILLPTSGVYVEADYIPLVAHEAAHTHIFHWMSPGWYPPPILQPWITTVEGAFGHNPPGIQSAFAGLANSGDALDESTCSYSYAYAGPPNIPDVGWSGGGPQAPAWGCAFALRPYGQTSVNEDIADWAALAVSDTHFGTPDQFCDRITTSLAGLPPEHLLHYGKAVLLHMSGFLPEEIAQGCMGDLIPWDSGPTATSRVFTVGSALPLVFDEPANNLTISIGELDLPSNNFEVEVHLEHPDINPWLSFGAVVRLDTTQSPETAPAWLQQASMRDSYVVHAQPSSVQPADGCIFPGGASGHSISGAALVFQTGAQTLGVAFPTRLACGFWVQDSGVYDYDFGDGGVVAFQVFPPMP